jgi:LppP/LprE lipoprotein
MRHVAVVVAALLLGAGAAAVAGGCGSSKKSVAVITETVTVGDHTTTTTHAATASTTSTSSSTTTSASTEGDGSGGVSAPESASGSGQGGSLSAAESTVQSKGYAPTVTFGYDPKSTLSVIVASGPQKQMQAFFFVNGKYIGTDTKDPSAGITLLGHDDTSATLGYAVYGPDDKLCCPVKTVKVTYALDNGKLEPQQEIPSASPDAQLSRR